MEGNKDTSAATHFGRQMKKERQARGWSLHELSRRTAYDAAHLTRIENGGRPPPPALRLTSVGREKKTGGRAAGHCTSCPGGRPTTRPPLAASRTGSARRPGHWPSPATLPFPSGTAGSPSTTTNHANGPRYRPDSATGPN